MFAETSNLSIPTNDYQVLDANTRVVKISNTYEQIHEYQNNWFFTQVKTELLNDLYKILLNNDLVKERTQNVMKSYNVFCFERLAKQRYKISRPFKNCQSITCYWHLIINPDKLMKWILFVFLKLIYYVPICFKIRFCLNLSRTIHNASSFAPSTSVW